MGSPCDGENAEGTVSTDALLRKVSVELWKPQIVADCQPNSGERRVGPDGCVPGRYPRFRGRFLSQTR